MVWANGYRVKISWLHRATRRLTGKTNLKPRHLEKPV
jgi:hypothetical protein